MQLQIDIRSENDTFIVTPHGEVDLASHGELKDAINGLVLAGHVHLVVDLSETTFLDSTGLAVLIGARRKAHAFRGSFAITCDNEDLLKLFRITNLDKVFTIRGSHTSDATEAAPPLPA